MAVRGTRRWLRPVWINLLVADMNRLDPLSDSDSDRWSQRVFSQYFQKLFLTDPFFRVFRRSSSRPLSETLRGRHSKSARRDGRAPLTRWLVGLRRRGPGLEKRAPLPGRRRATWRRNRHSWRLCRASRRIESGWESSRRPNGKEFPRGLAPDWRQRGRQQSIRRILPRGPCPGFSAARKMPEAATGRRRPFALRTACCLRYPCASFGVGLGRISPRVV